MKIVLKFQYQQFLHNYWNTKVLLGISTQSKIASFRDFFPPTEVSGNFLQCAFLCFTVYSVKVVMIFLSKLNLISLFSTWKFQRVDVNVKHPNLHFIFKCRGTFSLHLMPRLHS